MFLSDNKTGMYSKTGIESIEQFNILKRKDNILKGKQIIISEPKYFYNTKMSFIRN